MVFVCTDVSIADIKIEPMTTDINENYDGSYADDQGTLLELVHYYKQMYDPITPFLHSS